VTDNDAEEELLSGEIMLATTVHVDQADEDEDDDERRSLMESPEDSIAHADLGDLTSAALTMCSAQAFHQGVLKDFLEQHNLLFFPFHKTLVAAFGTENHATDDTKSTFAFPDLYLKLHVIGEGSFISPIVFSAV